MNQLIAYLMQNLIIDFQGELTLDVVRDFLREDDSREARQLLSRLVADGGVNDMMLTLADCLQEHVRAGISGQAVHEQLRLYAES